MVHNKETEPEPLIYGCTRTASAVLTHFICIAFTAGIAVLSRPGSILGLAAIFYNKHLNGKPHFTSWHGLLGLLTVCVVVFQSLAALPLIYHSWAKGWSLAKLKRYHAATGLVMYLLGTASLLLGLSSAWFTGSVREYTWYLSALCPALAALFMMNQVSRAYMAKKRLQS
ncbi:Cytochrome b561 domain-containing protein 2 [Collichthys lucidus]|uniref:ascorbate ferrireductase (transmembrane) n=1 Tax=Collichthys lucidus TaxID=240159 RepID=A0A4U5UAN0_COLLU|nr:Cytochrome b561 domain-containing protein 2 [Collichthys lucidus]